MRRVAGLHPSPPAELVSQMMSTNFLIAHSFSARELRVCAETVLAISQSDNVMSLRPWSTLNRKYLLLPSNRSCKLRATLEDDVAILFKALIIEVGESSIVTTSPRAAPMLSMHSRRRSGNCLRASWIRTSHGLLYQNVASTN